MGDGVDCNGEVMVLNTIIMNADRSGIRGGAKSNWNCLFGNRKNYSRGSIRGSEDITDIDPLNKDMPSLKYLVRIEPESPLKDAGKGKDIGANVMTRIGIPGTIYGEPGYKKDTGCPCGHSPTKG